MPEIGTEELEKFLIPEDLTSTCKDKCSYHIDPYRILWQLQLQFVLNLK